MAKEISKTQVDRLGDRIKRGQITEEDLRLLDRYRRSFTPAYEVIVGAIREKLDLEPTGRPAKSTISIIDKLKRESIRLTQIQDIAGCRIVVAGIAKQESTLQFLTDLFPHAIIIDRRAKPSHGYRAVHVVVTHDGMPIEIQVRTSLQHSWAEVSEKLSDVFGHSIKYGGGDESLQNHLQKLSELVAKIEQREKQLDRLLAESASTTQSPEDTWAEASDMRESLEQYRQQVNEICDAMIADIFLKTEGRI
jgi:putative GTP pyrophosphokinase